MYVLYIHIVRSTQYVALQKVVLQKVNFICTSIYLHKDRRTGTGAGAGAGAGTRTRTRTGAGAGAGHGEEREQDMTLPSLFTI